MSLYEGAVKKPIMTSLCFLAVVIFGLFSLSKLPIDLYPYVQDVSIVSYGIYLMNRLAMLLIMIFI